MNFQVTLIFQKLIYIKGEIYYSGVVTISSEDDENSAIILFLSEDTSDNDEKNIFYILKILSAILMLEKIKRG